MNIALFGYILAWLGVIYATVSTILVFIYYRQLSELQKRLVTEIANFGLVDMFNVHASSGVEAMKTVMDRIKDIPNKPLVLAVTALTSFDNESFKAIYNEDINTKATQFAKDTYASGIDGVVCSAFESLDIKNNTSCEFITLCPGIRPFGEDSGDQKRVADIPFAKENLVDFIVVGRPIYKADNPKEVVEKILQNI
jgi:orotidine-5'-phosphate decarboxylase